MLEILPIIPALCSILFNAHYAQNYAGIISASLPTTPTILLQMYDYWLPKSADPDVKILWVATIICFLDFFDLEKSQFQVLRHSIQIYIWPGVMSRWIIKTPLHH